MSAPLPDSLPGEVDVVVVGAGGAGMCAALAAAKQGLDVVLVEKSGYFGGSTARSGGGVWMPGNAALKAAGQVSADDLAQAKLYLDSIVGDEVPKVRRDTYLDRGPEVLDFIHAHTPVRFQWVPQYADYHPEAPGGRAAGRSCEPVPLDARFLGAELDRLHPQYTKAPANMIVTQADFRKISLGLRTWRGPATMVKVLLNRVISGLLRRRMYAMGNAIVIGLRKGLMDARRAGPLRHRADRPGRCERRPGHRRPGHPRRRGGDDPRPPRRDPRQRRLREEPRDAREVPAAPDLGRLDDRLASSTPAAASSPASRPAPRPRCMDDAWWGPTIPLPNGPWFCLAERNLPGSIIVNQAGRRYMNEALPYVEAVHAMYDGEATGVGHVPTLDGHRPALPQPLPVRRPLAAPALPRPLVQARHRQEGRHPRGAGRRDRRAGRRAARRRVERFNGFATSGVDEDFHRGESAYDKYYSDPTVKPNPSLHTIDHAPFYAVKIVPGDLGTKGGLVTDERARVLRPDGSVIGGLYAAGNVSSAVMGHTYAGPGATIGPALAFGYLAAEDIAHASVGAPLDPEQGDRLMPIDPEVAIGAPVGEVSFSWTSSDVLLYHLAIGAGSRPGDNVTPTRSAGPSTAPACRCCRRSAWWCRRSTRPTRRRWTCPAATSTCPRSCTARRRSPSTRRCRRPAPRPSARRSPTCGTRARPR